MKQPFARAVLAIPVALSACLTEPETGPKPPEQEDATPAVPERPIERVATSPLMVEREYRVLASPPVLSNGGLGNPGWDPIVKHSDTLAIAGDGDVHVIGDRTWYHFPALGGAPVATVIHEPGWFETPFAIAMRSATDPDPAIAAHLGHYGHPALRRFDTASRNDFSVCDIAAPNNNFGNWRLTKDTYGFWITGKQIIACDIAGGPRYIWPRSGQLRHPHAMSSTPTAGAWGLEVSQDGNTAFTEVRQETGGDSIGRRSLSIGYPITTGALWGAVEPGAATGYALVADDVNPCPASNTNCGDIHGTRFAIVPVDMRTGAHGNRYDHPVQYPGGIIGGMLLIDPLSHDLYALVTYEDPGGAVRTMVYQLYVDSSGTIQLRDGKSIPGASVHDAMLVGEDLYISLRTAAGALLQVRSLQLALRGEASYGNPGDYPMALKKSFAGEPYLLMKQGNELVVRKFGLDTDTDGLLDRWETMGMDLNHDGQIDFALDEIPGIDPLRKNIILELDVANGATDPRTYWLRIHQMFAAAPVTNPDGSTGITAILLFSENFENSTLPVSDDEELWQESLLFGDPADRGNANEQAILEAKFMVTRHVVVFPYRRISPRGGTMLGQVYGRPGHASQFIAIYDLFGPTLQAIHDALPTDDQLTLRASIFTHELGHALGLQHGGHDDIEFKPNYHSVMNLMRIVPRGWPLVAPDLAFADTAGPTLDENRLYENVGLGMNYTHQGHMVPYFTGPPGGPYQQLVGFETGPIFDFDGDGVFETPPVIADLTKDGELTTLEARADWAEIDWSLHNSAGWMETIAMSGTAGDDEDRLLVAGGWCDPAAALGCTCTVEGQTRPCGTDVGACTTGVQTCQNGFWGLCAGSVASLPERCDALDNDCDGTSNEGFPALGQACNVGVGACARSGSQVCSADQLGTTCNVSPGTPTDERCSNSVDDDCDGATDEGFATLGQTCTVGVGACARTSTFTCSADGLSAACPVTAGTPGTEVCNNGLDDDCDGLTDEDCLPTPISPPNGHMTGSSRVVSVAGQYNPRQVTFRWAATSPGATYEIQVDNAANFSSLEWLAATTSTTNTTSDLPISMSAPFGTRYYWRVRSRVGQQPWSAWSATHYLDVGRLPDDVNGDGYADVAAAALNSNGGTTGGGSVFVFHGRSAAPPTTVTRIHEFGGQAHAHFGAALAFTDMDGDGFSDLIVGIPDRTLSASYPGKGQAAIYFGSASGLPTAPSLILQAPVNESYANFGFAVAAAGDVDGDGYGDVWISAPDQDALIFWNNRYVSQPSVGVAYLYRGGPRGAISTTYSSSRTGGSPNARFGATMAAAGDVDGDGTTDMAFAAYSVGYVFVYSGNSSTVLANLTRPGTIGFGRSITAGDFDADGNVDLAIAAMSPAGYTIHRKTGSTISSTPWYTDNGGATSGDCQLASGDMDRDGDADLLIGYPYMGHGGQAVVFLSAPSFTYLGQWAEGSSQGAAQLGRGVTVADVNGDGRADVFVGEPRAHLYRPLLPAVARQGRMAHWPMNQTPTFGPPTTFFNLPYATQADAYFGAPLR